MRAAARADCAEQSAQRTFGNNSANWIQPSCKSEIALTATISISTKASQPRPLSRAAEYRHPSLADTVQATASGSGRLERVLPLCLSGLDSGVSSQIIGLARGNIGSKTPGGLLSSMDERTSVRLFASVLQTASPQAQKIKRASVEEWLWCTECDRDQCRLLRIKIRSGASCTSCAVGELVRL